MEKVGTLTDEAVKRKERLQKFKRKLEDDTPSSGDAQDDVSSSLPTPMFRNYEPQDGGLKENLLPKAKPESAEEQVKENLENGKSDELPSEVDLISLAPRKIDWDLKRDVSSKLEKLEKRTKKAIIALIKERLLQSNEVDLADVVNAGTENPVPQNAESDED